jgi:hypothetical protein
MKMKKNKRQKTDGYNFGKSKAEKKEKKTRNQKGALRNP